MNLIIPLLHAKHESGVYLNFVFQKLNDLNTYTLSKRPQF